MRLSNPALLIGDDDLNLREALGEVFRPRGFRTFLAANGEEALEILRHEVIHLALLDVHMPKLGGLETLQQVHELRILVPCILVSAQLDDFVLQKAREFQAYSVLFKPFSLAEIVRTVSKALEQIYHWQSHQFRSFDTSAEF